MIGSKSDYVLRLLVGHVIFLKIKDNHFFKIKNLQDDGSFYFGYIADSLRHNNIVEYLNIDMSNADPISDLNIKHLENWTTWLYKEIEIKGRITTRLKGKSQDLNMLNSILGNEIEIAAAVEKCKIIQ